MNRPLLLRIAAPESAGELDRAVRAALEAGFDGVDLALAGEGIKAQGRIGAVSIRCASCSVEAEVEPVGRWLRSAGQCGAAVLNLTVPGLALPTPGPADASSASEVCFTRYQDALNFAHELLHRVRLEAEAAGVALALEAPGHGVLHSPVELREIIDAANSWAVGACVDCSRVLALGGSPADWIETLGHRLRAVRVAGWPEGGEGALRAALRETPADSPWIASCEEVLPVLADWSTSPGATRTPPGFARE